MVKHLSLGGEGGAARALDATFGALSDATRRGILARLALGESSVSELAAPYEMSLPAVSKHLRVLEGAGLVVRHKDGRVHRCRLIAEPMKSAAEWIERYRMFWEEQFDALERYLAETGALTTSAKPEQVLPRAAKGVEAISDLRFEISKKLEGSKKAKRRGSRRKKS
jgi:DNA-binding transcriptional ArsR family regulator